MTRLQEHEAFSNWLKGGLRYKRLTARLVDHLAPADVQAFFIGIKSAGRFQLLNPFSPFQREYVIAATNAGVSVLRLRRPGVFSAKVAEIEYQAPADVVRVEWCDGKFILNDIEYQPISFHDEDAEQVARLLGD